MTGCVLWGVGNHGGGSSRKDLEQIGELMREEKGESILPGSSIRPVEDRALRTLDYGLEIVGKWKRRAFLLAGERKTKRSLRRAVYSGRPFVEKFRALYRQEDWKIWTKMT